MKRINQEEYEVLKELDDKWKWIARDSNTSLWAYKTKPIRFGGSFGFEDPAEGNCHYIYADLFNFARWEDEKPYSIAELVEEYENSAEHVSHVVNEKVKALGKAWGESEETEVKKDIEWLKEEIGNLVEPYDMRDMLTYRAGVVDTVKYMLHLINQLDEPEILSQEWIEGHVVYADVRGGTQEFIHVNDLQNLLVSKRE